MAEIVTLTAPITKPSATSIQITKLVIDVANRVVAVHFRGNTGDPGVALYPTPSTGSQPSGAQLINGLNTVDLRSNSLIRRLIVRLQTDGHIPAGSIGGTPDIPEASLFVPPQQSALLTSPIEESSVAKEATEEAKPTIFGRLRNLFSY